MSQTIVPKIVPNIVPSPPNISSYELQFISASCPVSHAAVADSTEHSASILQSKIHFFFTPTQECLRKVMSYCLDKLQNEGLLTCESVCTIYRVQPVLVAASIQDRCLGLFSLPPHLSWTPSLLVMELAWHHPVQTTSLRLMQPPVQTPYFGLIVLRGKPCYSLTSWFSSMLGNRILTNYSTSSFVSVWSTSCRPS